MKKGDALDNIDLDLNNIKNILCKKGKGIGITKILSKKKSLIVERSEIIKLKISNKKGKIKINPEFPSIGNSVQMVSSLIFMLLFFLLGVPFSIFFAIIFGQVFSLLFYYPKSLRFKKEVLAVLESNRYRI